MNWSEKKLEDAHSVGVDLSVYLEHITALGASNAALEHEKANLEKGNRLLAERISAAEEGNRELVRRAQQAEGEVESLKGALSAKANECRRLRDDEAVWRKRVEAAAEELAEAGAGEVGRLDIVSRVRRLKGQLSESRIAHDTQEKVDTGIIERLEARCATLAAAGQVLSEHVDHVADARLPSNAHPHFGTFPCSPTCTHDDAAKPGHHERVKERSEAVLAAITRCPKCGGDVEEGYGQASGAIQPSPYLYCLKSCGWRQTIKGEVVWNPTREQEAWFDSGAEAMRAACWEAVAKRLQFHGLWHRRDDFKSAIEGAVP